MPKKVPPPVRTEAGCLEYQGYTNKKGYGQAGRRDGTTLVHRQALQDHIGRILEPGEVAMHTCDNPPCIELSHLQVGSVADNNADKSGKGRHRNRTTGATHCREGHAFTLENTLVEGTTRRCRLCARKWQREYMPQYRERKKRAI